MNECIYPLIHNNLESFHDCGRVYATENFKCFSIGCCYCNEKFTFFDIFVHHMKTVHIDLQHNDVKNIPLVTTPELINGNEESNHSSNESISPHLMIFKDEFEDEEIQSIINGNENENENGNDNDSDSDIIILDESELSRSNCNDIVKIESDDELLLFYDDKTETETSTITNTTTAFRNDSFGYKCKTCNKSFRYISKLKTHEDIHNESKQYACYYCPRSYKQKRNLLQHFDRIHKKQIAHKSISRRKSTTTKFEYYTKKKMEDLKTLTREMEDHLINDDEIKEEPLLLPMTESQSSTSVLANKKKPSKYDDNRMKNRCQYCNKSFSCKGNFVSHMDLHEGKQFSCIYCDRVYKYKKNVIQHFRDKHKELSPKHKHGQIYKLVLLKEQQFDYTKDRRKQLIKHTCHTCHKIFSCKSKLLSHAEVHQERQYICIYCGKGYKQKRNLKRHFIKVHKNPKDFTATASTTT